MSRNLVQLSQLDDLEIQEVKQFPNRDRDRPDFDNKYLKIFYFFRKEGIISTLRKYFAHKQEQVRYLTVLRVSHEGDSWLNVSVQSQTDPSYFVISNRFYSCEQIHYERIRENVELYLEQFNQFDGKENYKLLNVTSDTPVHFKLKARSYKDSYDRGLFIYGLGGYVQMFIMHHFRRLEKIACVDYKYNVASKFQQKYGFRYKYVVPGDSYPLLKLTKRPVVIIATYHSDHASIAEEVFHTNPKAQIFIEKPPTVTMDDLEKLIRLYRDGAFLHMGFNRRFIPWNRDVKALVKDQVLVITCTVKEVVISPNHWYFWDHQGTRITGNVVHWIDLANYWIQSDPVEINVMASPDNRENVAISVLFRNGSLLNITASDQGNSLRGVQEKIEVRYGNETVFIDDFNQFVQYRNNGRMKKRRKLRRYKGHSEMYRNFSKIIEGKDSYEYSVRDLINTSVVTFYASDMLKNGTRTAQIGEVIDHYHSCKE